ncbi:hypothetical protein T10_3702 [Trichinella papuae]|uniref:Uncharacterized protein n=1 Tax=Trichinella papuae TaxID=268474 RepID=A0A0V1MCZ5_9BILA|nr:hypothetical protein T10_3702 [Trichinella papuae]
MCNKRLRALVTGCFTKETNSPDLKHDPSIAISIRESCHMKWKVEVADFPGTLWLSQTMHLVARRCDRSCEQLAN